MSTYLKSKPYIWQEGDRCTPWLENHRIVSLRGVREVIYHTLCEVLLINYIGFNNVKQFRSCMFLTHQ